MRLRRQTSSTKSTKCRYSKIMEFGWKYNHNEDLYLSYYDSMLIIQQLVIKLHLITEVCLPWKVLEGFLFIQNLNAISL